jgi:hypothetical protein
MIAYSPGSLAPVDVDVDNLFDVFLEGRDGAGDCSELLGRQTSKH